MTEEKYPVVLIEGFYRDSHTMQEKKENVMSPYRDSGEASQLGINSCVCVCVLSIG